MNCCPEKICYLQEYQCTQGDCNYNKLPCWFLEGLFVHLLMSQWWKKWLRCCRVVTLFAHDSMTPKFLSSGINNSGKKNSEHIQKKGGKIRPSQRLFVHTTFLSTASRKRESKSPHGREHQLYHYPK